jgi:hypothetical protein
MFGISSPYVSVIAVELSLFLVSFFVCFLLLFCTLPKQLKPKIKLFLLTKSTVVCIAAFLLLLIFGLISLFTNSLVLIGICSLTLVFFYGVYKKSFSPKTAYWVIVCISFVVSILFINGQFLLHTHVQQNNIQKQRTFINTMAKQYSILAIKKSKINELTVTVSVAKTGRFLIVARGYDSTMIIDNKYNINQYQDAGLIISGEPGWVNLQQGISDIIIKTHNNRSLYAVKNMDLVVSIQPENQTTPFLLETNSTVSKLLLLPNEKTEYKEGVYYYSPNLLCDASLQLPCFQLSLLHISLK